ncbi:GntR family transcriptional regulator [Diaphorobacter sp.]|uniref:GntR family transcriptional regulator n=1 Tax=Diaphorobacter sp. TaxID=1934310 RepID=UPI0028AF8B75|nr:GntR family transcriptional regulator [Diaphorobacter sp.]
MPPSSSSPGDLLQAPSPFVLPEPFQHIVLDAGRHEPLWRQLFQQIGHLLTTGALMEGMSLPAERDMAEALGVSRITVKRCYDELRKLGALGGRGRAGSVVQAGGLPHRVQPTLGKLKGFTEEMHELGMRASTQLLVLEKRSDARIAAMFERPAKAPFLHVVRIRLGDDVPMTREQAWYDLTAAPLLGDWNGEGSAYAWLRERCGLPLSHAEQTVEAVLSSAEEMSAFGYDAPRPCLLFKRRTFSGSTPDMLVEYVEGTFRGDAYVYKTVLAV